MSCKDCKSCHHKKDLDRYIQYLKESGERIQYLKERGERCQKEMRKSLTDMHEAIIRYRAI